MLKKEIVQEIHKYKKDLKLINSEIRRLTRTKYRESYDKDYLENLVNSNKSLQISLSNRKMLLKQCKREEKLSKNNLIFQSQAA